jgi:hypothetical protein
MLGSRAASFFSFFLSVGARHAVPERSNSTIAPNQQSQPNAFFRFLVSHMHDQASLRRTLKPTLLKGKNARSPRAKHQR